MTAKTISSGTTVSAGYTISAADGNGFALTNLGVIGATGAGLGLEVQTTGDLVFNSGKILASTATGTGIFSSQSVRITNSSGGLISASQGIRLGGGGTIDNASGGSITGLDPIYASAASVYVGNQGGIAGTGTNSTDAGVVLNAGGYVYNKPGGSISGANGVFEGAFATVRNEGTIVGNSANGVDLTAGGTVTTETQTPNSAATISGSYGGIIVSGGAGYVLNASGKISGGVAGVFLQNGGFLHQIGGTGGGTISANYAVAINNGSGTVETGGVIIGGALGVGMDGAGPHKVTLAALGASISGAKAISISGGNGYIYTQGTINGGVDGTAITMAGGYTNLLEIYSGATIIGSVDGGNFQGGPHLTTLLLAQGGFIGTLTGFGSRYFDIGAVTVKAGASWTMDSTNVFADPSLVSAGSTTFFPVKLTDAGTLNFGGTAFNRMTLASNAHLTVAKAGVITPAYASQAIYAPSLTTSPIVVTDGHITAAGNDGIRLDDGGSVTNQADGVISAHFAGVRITNASGTVANSGLISSAYTYGIGLGKGGTVTNTGGTIMGTLGVSIYGGVGAVTNTGLIAGGATNDGVVLQAGGTVLNRGTISGLGGVFIKGGPGTVTNYGQITGIGIYSVNMVAGYANRLRIGPGAAFSGNFVNGGNTAGATAASTIELLSAANAGTINGIGSEYRYFANITVDSGATWTIGPSGSIAAYQTLVDSGTMINEVFVASEVTLANGTFINASGYLSGTVGVSGLSGTNVVVNNSNIRATEIGVSLATAGRVTNQSDGFIGGRLGVYIGQGPGASVVNQGLIEGYLAVYLPKGGSVDNQGGLISGRLGVVINDGNGTVRNAGIIASVGDYGVILPDHGADRLVLVPGSTIVGLVHGGLAGTGTAFSTLELASGSSAGTIGSIGSKYLNFRAIAVDAGAAWTFAPGQTIAANQALYDNGTLTNNAVVLTEIQLGAGAALTNARGGTVSAISPVLAGNSLASPTTVVNYGLIDSGTNSYGVELLSGGSVTNRAGTIKGRSGVVIDHGGTVTNTGSIVGSSGTAVLFVAGFQNRVAMSPGAVFSGKVDGGNISAAGTAISTLELMTDARVGTLSGIGSQYVNFQNFLVDPGASWSISAGQSIPATYTLTDRGTLTNDATVLSGVTLGAGASVTNSPGATISSSSDGVLAQGAGATVVNHGTLGGGSLGVSLIGGNAAVTNLEGTISGGVFGVTISGGAGTVANYGGLVLGGLAGIDLSGGGTVLNQLGEIAGIVSDGIFIAGGAGTVANYGTILGGGGTAVALAAGFENLIKVRPGAVFSGIVDGGNTINASNVSILELTPGYVFGLGNLAGTVSGLGGQYVNFGEITIDPGASWAVTGSPTLAAGITLTNSGALAISDGALNVAGNLYNLGIIQENAGTLTAGTLSGNGEMLIGAGSTLTVSGSVAVGQTIDFAGAGLLALDPTQFSGQIDGLGSGGRIALAGIADAISASVVNGNTLAIQQSAGPTLGLILDPTQNYAAVVFDIATLNGNQFVEGGSPTGPTVIDQGETMSVTGAAGSTMAAITGALGGITVTGANSLLNTTDGPFIIGDGGQGGLAIESGATVTTSLGSDSASAAAVIASQAGSGGSSVNVTGAGSNWQVTGALVVGKSGFGQLSVAQGASVTVGSADLASGSGGDGVLTVTGTGSTLTLTGNLTVGDQASGSLRVDNGANVTVASLTIGAGATGVGNVEIDPGSILTLTTTAITIGLAGSAVLDIQGGTLDLAPGTTLGAGPNGRIVQVGGKIDPAATLDASGGSFGGGGIAEVSVVILNDSLASVSGGAETLLAPSISAPDPVNDVGDWKLTSGGTLVLDTNTIDNSQTITFGDTTGVLVIGQQVTLDESSTPQTIAASALGGFAAPIVGFRTGDQILFQGLTVASDSIVGGNTLELFGTGNALLGELTFLNSHGNADNTGATDAAAQLACFASGTRIATASGPVAVEALRVGDRVVSAFGGVAEVVWLGHRRVDCRRHARPQDVWPIRVAAGAFGAGLPCCDLWLSPDHAVYIENVLMPIRYLVNGATIRREAREEVTYWHVELRQHDVILAEGLPCESYLDTGNRSAFTNGGTEMILHPDFARHVWDIGGCARLVLAGPELVALRRGLLERAEALGHVVTGDAALHAVVDGRVVLPEIAGRTRRFRLPASARMVRLRSRSAVPAETRADSNDYRRLGVAISGLTLDGRTLALIDPRLTSGWHAAESVAAGDGQGVIPDWRWTDGDAGLALAGASVLEIEIAITEQYWLEQYWLKSSESWECAA